MAAPTCQHCHGKGVVTVTRDGKEVTKTCPVCGGTKQAGPRPK